MEVVVESVAGRGRPGKRPPHPPLVRLQLRERRPRHRCQRDVVVRQVDDGAVETVRDRRAGRTSRRVVGPEHEVVDEELRAPSEEVCQRGAPFIGLECVPLVDPDPRQLLPSPRQLVAAPRQLLLRLKQLEPLRKPLFTCPGLVLGHRSPPYVSLRRTPATVGPRRPIAPRSGRDTALLSPGVLCSRPTRPPAPPGMCLRAPTTLYRLCGASPMPPE